MKEVKDLGPRWVIVLPESGELGTFTCTKGHYTNMGKYESSYKGKKQIDAKNHKVTLYRNCSVCGEEMLLTYPIMRCWELDPICTLHFGPK